MDPLSKNWGKGKLLHISIYDQECYYSVDYESKEIALKKEKEKRDNLKEQGYDVDKYEQMYYSLVNEGRNKVNAAKHISEADEIYILYEQKKKNLAKEYLDIDWN